MGWLNRYYRRIDVGDGSADRVRPLDGEHDSGENHDHQERGGFGEAEFGTHGEPPGQEWECYMAAEYVPGVFCDGATKQPADFAKVEFRRRDVSLLVCIGVGVTKDSNHLLGELPTVQDG